MVNIHFDGSCAPINPGGTGGIGVLIERSGYVVKEISRVIGAGPGMSNNVAEYTAVKAALEYLIEHDLTDEPIAIYGDSMLVIKQMQGAWKIKKGMYVKVALETQAMLPKFKRLSWHWIPREQNSLADELSSLGGLGVGVEQA